MNGMGYVFICFCCGLGAGITGRHKGSSFWLWFAIAFVIPLVGNLAALLWRYEQDEVYRRCDECGHVMPLYQQVCNRCGADQEWPEEVPSAAG